MKVNYRKEARGRDCQIRIPECCNRDPDTTVLCHLPGAGMGRKHNDLFAAWGCSSCHDAVDARTIVKQPATLLALWHHEAVIRTQMILMDEGKL